MLLEDQYVGENAPFEGDLTLWLRSLPSGAQVRKATIRLEPTDSDAVIDFADSQHTFGATRIPATDTPASLVEVDFHARRTLVSVEGSVTVSGGKPTLQVDMGGTYIGIANDGTFMAPGKTPWSVTLSSGPSPLPGLTVSKFSLSGASNVPNPPDTQLKITKVHIRPLPTNISVRLGQLPTFWTHLGELAVPDTSSDFAVVLNAFLATAQSQNGFYAIPFVIHSDALARLNVIVTIDYVITQPVLPSYLPEATLSYAFNPLPDIDEEVTTVALPRGAVPLAGNAQIRGEFQPTRVALNMADDLSAKANVLVSPECSLAQPLQSGTEIEVTGIDLPLFITTPGLTDLNIAIRDDNDGKPSSTVLASANVIAGKPLPDQSVWGSATLPKPFRVLSKDKQGHQIRYWLVLQSQNGQAYWKAMPGGSPPLQCSRDDGISWRAASSDEALAPLSAQFRLRNTPGRFSIPVQLQIGNGKKPGAVRRTLDKFAPLGRIEFRFDFAEKLGEYLTGPATTSPCGNQDMVVNGDFADPPPDDATFKLFGFWFRSPEANIKGKVKLSPRINLSVERFITLSIDQSTPQRIDCAGRIPAQTQPDEIVYAINQAIGKQVEVAKLDTTDGTLVLAAPPDATSIALSPWCSSQVPSSWQGTSEVYRLRAPVETGRIFTVLADLSGIGIPLFCFPSGPPSLSAALVSLSQQVSVAAGCAYRLQIGFLVSSIKAKHTSFASLFLSIAASRQIIAASPPRWEVAWLDASGTPLCTDREDFDIVRRGGQLSYIDARLVAPANAVKAELRFINPTPDEYFLALERVTFTPTPQALCNSDFQQWAGERDSRSPAGWTLLSGLLAQGMGLSGVKLYGNGPEDTVLSQTADVITGERYELQVRAQPESPPTTGLEQLPVQQRARLELRWLSAGSPGESVVLFLDGQNFSASAWTGVAPAGANQAEIRIIQPRGMGNLLVESVTLARSDLVPVPLIFLAEAPGQLTVSNMHVVYDLPESPKLSRQPVPAAFRAMVPVSQPPAANVPIEPVIAMPPLTAIHGIGEARARQLEMVGIDSVEKLAAAAPEEIVQALPGVNVEMATKFITEAKQLMSAQSPGTASQ